MNSWIILGIGVILGWIIRGLITLFNKKNG